ncbi:hypothetical protein [Pseudomonas chlororaphis]|uniref:hypothetical protein n=1 Tax=Pseudomonas chlororaphis TaxID=587753 RepID=UPI0012D7D8D0|nr:hypothetical protein [Pseudomonas chlororaphis]
MKSSLHAVSPCVEAGSLASPSQISRVNDIKHSPKMRSLFVCTMQQDVRLLKKALKQNTHRVISEKLYSISSALGVMQYIDLARDCTELSCLLMEEKLDTSYALKINQILDRLSVIVKNPDIQLSFTKKS